MSAAPTSENPPLAEWSRLVFNPAGLTNLRRYLGRPSVYAAYRDRFRAADMAWFTAGLAKQVCNVRRDEFYPDLIALRRNTSSSDERKELRLHLRDLAFDTATLLDRTFGSTTLIIHVPGTTRPGSPKSPEFIKADVYFPAHMSRENAGCANAVNDIVQRFIADIGLATITRFERSAPRQWMNARTIREPPRYTANDINTDEYPPGSSVSQHIGQPQSTIADLDGKEDDEFTFTRSQHALLDRYEAEGLLKAELRAVKQKLEETEEALLVARGRENDALDEIERLSGLIHTYVPQSSATPSNALRPQTPGPRRSSKKASSQVPSTPSTSTSVRSSHKFQDSPTSLGSVSSPSRKGEVPRSSTRASNVSVKYGDFLATHELERKLFFIEAIRTSSPPFLWQRELENLGIQGDVAVELMGIMSVDEDLA